MNDKPETPREGAEQPRPETPRDEGTPTVNISGPYALPPRPSEPSNWQPGQYSSGRPESVPPPPSYSQAPASQPPEYGGYTPPTGGQPTQYMPPPQYGQSQDFPQSGSPAVYNEVQPPAYSPAGYPQPQQGTGYVPRDPTLCLLLELFGYVGFLGIGHIYAGKTVRGIGLMVGFWVYLAMSTFLIIFLVGCLLLLVGLAVPIASGLFLKNEVEKEQAAMGIRRV